MVRLSKQCTSPSTMQNEVLRTESGIVKSTPIESLHMLTRGLSFQCLQEAFFKV